MYKGGLYVPVGDSTTYRSIAAGGVEKAYTRQIYDSIVANYGRIAFVHNGISGSMAGDAVKDFQWFGAYWEPDLVTIGFGMNEGYFYSGTNPVSSYKSNLSYIVDRFRRQNTNAHIILCTPNSVSDAAKNTTLDGYRTGMQEVAAAEGVDVCNFHLAWTQAQAAANTSDGLHPNFTGHTLLYNQAWPIVQKGAWLQSINK